MFYAVRLLRMISGGIVLYVEDGYQEWLRTSMNMREALGTPATGSTQHNCTVLHNQHAPEMED